MARPVRAGRAVVAPAFLIRRTPHARHPHPRHRSRPGRPGRQPVPDRGVRRPRGARAGTRRRPVARPDVGVAAAPHAELGLAAAGLELSGARSRRLHDGARVRRIPVPATPAPSTPRSRSTATSARCGGPRAVSWSRRRRVASRARQRRDGDRLVRQAARAAARRPAAVRRDAAHAERLPLPRRPPGWPGARRGRLGDGCPARRRARPGRARGRPGRRPAQPRAPPLPGDGHLVVARPDRHLRCHDRRGRRPGAGASGGSAAAHRP